MSVRQPLYLILCLITAIASAVGQTFGEVTGTVSDSSAAIVAGAVVTLINTETSQARKVETNETGNYTIPFVPPGVYQIRVEKPGFKSATRSDVRVQVADSVRVNFAIEVGSVSESIEVQGGTPLLTTENATVGTVIDTGASSNCR